MDFKFLDDLNRKLDAIHSPSLSKAFAEISKIAALSESSTLNPAFTNPINEAILSSSLMLNPAFTESIKGAKFTEVLLNARSAYNIPIISQGLIDSIQNSINASQIIPHKFAALQEYIDKMRPLSYVLEYQREYSVLLKATEIVGFAYDWTQVIQDNLSEAKAVKEETIVRKANSIQTTIHGIYLDNSRLLTVHPREFEKMIAELMMFQGYEVELTKQTRDGGYDIIALKTLDGFPLKFLVECKRNTEDPVGVAVVRGFCDVLTNTEKANKGIIVTTSYFSPEAEQRRLQNPYLLDFRDREDVLKWVSDYTLFKI